MDPTVLTTGIPWLDKTLAVIAALVTLCSVLAHVVPHDTIPGKLISWVALNFGKKLVTPADGTLIEIAPPSSAPKGYARLRTLAWMAFVAAFIAILGTARAARADTAPADPAPAGSQFGGCVASGKVCFAPSIALSLAAVNLSTGKIEAAFAPGLGYGFSVNPGSWKSVGADVYVTLSPAAQQASVSLLAKFFNGYFRPGLSKSFISDHSMRLLFSTGIDVP